MKKIVFELAGAKAVAVLRETETPKTCRVIWNMLPLASKSIHANWAGREIMLHLEGPNYVELKQEGDKNPPSQCCIEYFYRTPTVLRGTQSAYSNQFRRGLCELAIYYGDEGPSMKDPGREPDRHRIVNNWFASFVQPLPTEFVKACDSLNFTGMKTLTVRKLRK